MFAFTCALPRYDTCHGHNLLLTKPLVLWHATLLNNLHPHTCGVQKYVLYSPSHLRIFQYLHSSSTFQFSHDGYVVLDDFLTAEEVEELRAAGNELVQNIPQETHKALFSTTDAQQVTNGMLFSYVKLIEIHNFAQDMATFLANIAT